MHKLLLVLAFLSSMQNSWAMNYLLLFDHIYHSYTDELVPQKAAEGEEKGPNSGPNELWGALFLAVAATCMVGMACQNSSEGFFEIDAPQLISEISSELSAD